MKNLINRHRNGAFLINKAKGGNNLATKLEGLHIKKVDFVDQELTRWQILR